MRRPSGNIVDGVGAILTIAAGVFTIVEAFSYTLGQPHRMGPGFFPVMLGIWLTLLGLSLLGSARKSTTPRPGRIAVRPLVAIMTGIASFAFLLPRFGLAPASVGLVIVSAFAERNRSIVGIAVLAVCLAMVVVVIFILLLGLPLDIADWPPAWG